MQRGLTIEDNIIIIAKMSLDDVSKVEISIGEILSVCQIDLFTIVSDDVFGTWPSCGSVADKLFHDLEIFSSHVFWNSKVFGNGLGNSKLIKLENGIWSNDSTS